MHHKSQMFEQLDKSDVSSDEERCAARKRTPIMPLYIDKVKNRLLVWRENNVIFFAYNYVTDF
jgi:hypothetical protein